MPAGKDNIHEVKFDSARIEDVRENLRKSVEDIIDCLGDDIAGFAIVGWGMGGHPAMAYFSRYGLVFRGLIPSFVRDALQRQITIDMVEEGVESHVPGQG